MFSGAKRSYRNLFDSPSGYIGDLADGAMGDTTGTKYNLVNRMRCARLKRFDTDNRWCVISISVARHAGEIVQKILGLLIAWVLEVSGLGLGLGLGAVLERLMWALDAPELEL